MKKTFMFAATAAIVLSSCSKVETAHEDIIPNDPSKISFTGTTTRANSYSLDDLAGGFPVYGYAANGATWYDDGTVATVLNGTYDYYKPAALDNTVSDYNGWQWKLGTGTTSVEAPEWPTNINAWPMNFVAFYPKSTSVSATFTPFNAGVAPASATITDDIVVKSSRYEQEDHLQATAEAASQPTGGLALKFYHMMSKVNVTASTAANFNFVVNKVVLKNVQSNEATYTYAGATKGWSAHNAATFDYTYRETVFENSTEWAANKWKTPMTAAESASLVQTNTTLSPAVNGDLMILPQETAVVDITAAANKADFITNHDNDVVYFEVLYRVKNASGNDVVGVGEIGNTTKPIYNIDGTAVVATADIVGEEYDGHKIVGNEDLYVNNGIIQDTDELYVKVYFPINSAAALKWDPAKGYTYNLLLSNEGSGGIYADNVYYDEAGIATKYTHTGEKGEEVFSNRMHFDVIIVDWDNSTTPVDL